MLLGTCLGVPQRVLSEWFLAVLGLKKGRKALKKHSSGHSEAGAQKHSKSTPWGTFRPLGTPVNGGWHRNSKGQFAYLKLRSIYHHHPESKKRKSSEGNFGSIHPYGRYGNVGNSSKTISTIAILWPVRAIFEKRESGVGVDTFVYPAYLTLFKTNHFR